MRVVKNLKDVQIILNELLDFKTRMDSQSIDLHGRRIVNAGTSVDSSDYVTKAELLNLNGTTVPDPHVFTIVFTNPSPSDDLTLPSYLAGKDRSGYPQDTWIMVDSCDSDVSVDFFIDGTKLLVSPLTATTEALKVHAANFVSPLSKIGYSSKVTCIINTAGNAVNLSVGLVVNRFN